MSATDVQRIEATFSTDSWEETPVALTPDSPLKKTRVRTTRTFTGGMEGSAITEYTMVYHPTPAGSAPTSDKHAVTASFAGLMHFAGSINGSPPGEAVFVTTGTFEGTADAEWVLDERTASGGLANMKAKGGYSSKGITATQSWLEIQKAK
ncbi:hypothetical protein BOTBODRAFT_177753 [Botryobasidium botryosum FD-172 SS1]|uniref:DUF3224 domain-containing protein n=1 Tax=Botryobasidium botryosum (strain FD-172 SS1) TaxID=930990 RepID=A0A067MH46_BOTB1|nr:hypothetical protein BOTBODRAFT_177753 [Botryobasidium botryosum FD-172 SS1]